MFTQKACAVIFCLFCCMITIILFLPEPVNSYECRVIRIFGEATQAGKIHLEPNILTISKGTCVIWLNWSKEQEVMVTFDESQRCHDVTDAPAFFALDAANCYVTSWIANGGTSSLRFNDSGEFQFTITNTDGSTTKGRIFVTE